MIGQTSTCLKIVPICPSSRRILWEALSLEHRYSPDTDEQVPREELERRGWGSGRSAMFRQESRSGTQQDSRTQWYALGLIPDRGAHTGMAPRRGDTGRAEGCDQDGTRTGLPSLKYITARLCAPCTLLSRWLIPTLVSPHPSSEGLPRCFVRHTALPVSPQHEHLGHSFSQPVALK